MSTFEEVKAAIEGLWADELAEIEKRERETEARAEELRREHARLRGVVSAGERELGALRSELSDLPRLMGLAQLEDDQAEVLALQGRFSEVRERSAAVEEVIDAERRRLAELLGPAGDLETAVRGVETSFWGRGARVELARRVREEEFKVLREALEDRLSAVAPRTWEERSRDEETAARRRKNGQGALPGLRVAGASLPADGAGLEVVADGMGGNPSRESGSGTLVVVSPGPSELR